MIIFIILKDKTFGLKNKKGAKQQKFINQVEKQVKTGGLHPRKVDDPNAKKLEKEKKLKEQQELAMIFKPVQTQKIEKGLTLNSYYIFMLENKKLIIFLKAQILNQLCVHFLSKVNVQKVTNVNSLMTLQLKGKQKNGLCIVI